MDKREDTSIWKKEITFRRKPKPPAADVASAVPPTGAAAPAKPPETSIWKKDIAFRRKAEAAPDTESAVEWTARRAPESEAPLAPPAMSPVTQSAMPPVAPQVAPTPAQPLPPSRPAPETVGPGAEPVAAEVAGQAPTWEIEAAAAVREVEAGAGSAPAAELVALPAPVPVPEFEPQVESEPELEPDSEPEFEPAAESDVEPTPEGPTLSRRQAREERRNAERLAKEQAKVAKANGQPRSGAHNQLVGLKIGASQIAAAQVINKGGPRIVRMARMPLEPGVVVGGELREPEELAAILKTFFRKNKLPRTCVRLGLSNNRIGVRTFEVTGIEDPKQLANAVRFRAQETLPIPLDEAVLDHRILDDRIGEDGVRVCRVLLVVAHRELVERYVGACRKAGLKLVGIDLEAFALLRAVSDPASPPGDDAAVVCVSIGHDRSTLAVSDGRICEFTRVLAWGGSALDVALARVLDLTPSAVVPIKHALSLGEEGAGAGLDAHQADEARRVMTGELQSFARELVASLRFYQEQANSLGIVEILITGGAAACGGLAAELERLIGIPVRVVDPLSRVKVARRLQVGEDASTASMAVAVGLGIED